MDIDESRREASRAFKRREFDKALDLSLALSQYNVYEALYTCAIIYEEGVSLQGRNLEAAYKYFDRLRRACDADEGYVGCARIILEKRDIENVQLAEEYCRTAIEKGNNPFAYFILGRIFEDFKTPPDLVEAKKMYAAAALRGAAWGMRRFAIVEWKRSNYLVSIFAHIAATIFFPFYRLFGGQRALRMG